MKSQIICQASAGGAKERRLDALGEVLRLQERVFERRGCDKRCEELEGVDWRRGQPGCPSRMLMGLHLGSRDEMATFFMKVEMRGVWSSLES